MPTQLGVPVKLLHECEGHKVSVELTNGEIYRGMMVDAEDCMNMQLQQVTLTGRDGKISKLDFVYIRGSKIRLVILPDMLKNAPMFKRFDLKNKVSKTQAGLGFGFGGIQSVVGGGPGGRGRGAPGAGRGRGRGN